MNATTPVLRAALAWATLALSALPVTGALAASPADTAPWPTARPITWIVGFPPGGSLDVLTRVAARKLSEKTGQSVVVENRPGASGLIALQTAARGAPDAYTLITLPGPLLFTQRVPELGRELTAVASLAQGPMVLVGPASNTPSTVQELIADMRKHPKLWSYASSGNGTSQHLAGELFNMATGTAMTHVPYKGGGQAVADVVGGQIPLAMLGVTPVVQQIRSGKLKAYAVTTRYRIDSLPNVPTMQEAGLTGYDASQWYIVAAPAGTPADRIERLNQWMSEITASQDMKPALDASGSVAGTGSAQAVHDFVTQDLQRWRDLADKARLNLN
jgi:tripartite-type tricarboxylate transporter receptor subunit TctC